VGKKLRASGEEAFVRGWEVAFVRGGEVALCFVSPLSKEGRRPEEGVGPLRPFGRGVVLRVRIPVFQSRPTRPCSTTTRRASRSPAEEPVRGAPEGHRGAPLCDRRAAWAPLDSAGQNRLVDLAQLIESLKQDVAKLRGSIEVLSNQTGDARAAPEGPLRRPGQPLRKLEQTQTQLQGQAEPGRTQRGRREAGLRAGAQPVQARQLPALHHQLPEFHEQFREQRLLPSRSTGSAMLITRCATTSPPSPPSRKWSSLAGQLEGARRAAHIASSQAELGESAAARETLRGW